MRFPFLLLAFALSFATPAMAQGPKPVDPAALAQAKDLLEKSNAAALGQQVMNALVSAQKARLERANPGHLAEINEVLGLMQAEFAKEFPTLIEAIATIYARLFTTEELAQISAFYDSPAGRKMVKEMPAILSETMSVAQLVGHKITMEVIAKLRPEIEKRKLKVDPGNP